MLGHKFHSRISSIVITFDSENLGYINSSDALIIYKSLFDTDGLRSSLIKFFNSELCNMYAYYVLYTAKTFSLTC